jgi:hypothetical protein
MCLWQKSAKWKSKKKEVNEKRRRTYFIKIYGGKLSFEFFNSIFLSSFALTLLILLKLE